MKIRKRPQKKSLWNILPRAVKKRIWMPGLFALLLGTDEALKARDLQKWIGLMNNYRHCAAEIVRKDWVYS